MTGIISFFQQGGIFMLPIVLVGVGVLMISVERYRTLFKVYSPEYETLWSKVKGLIQQNQIAEAVRTTQAAPTLYGKVIKAGLSRATRDEQQIQNAIDVETMRHLPNVQAKLGHLSLFASVATLLGLLGTIAGLVQAFAAVAQADPAQKQTLLANGISVAMNTTEFGLMIAIPTMLLHGWFSARAKKIMLAMTQLSTEVVDLLSGQLYEWMENERRDAQSEVSRTSSSPSLGAEV